MKMTTLKKILAVLAAAAMLVCVLAGCGDQAAPQQTDPVAGGETQGTVVDTNPTGMLVLSTEAAVKVTYDADGMALKVEGINDYGIVLADEYTDYTGKSCADVVSDLINASIDAGNLSPDVKNVIIKLIVGSAQPGTNFLETIGTEAQNTLDTAGSSSKLTVIGTDDLTEDGYISLDVVKALLMNQLGVEKLDAYYGSDTPTNDTYICTVDVGGVESAYTINAVTGLIAEATDEDLMNDPEATEEYYYEEEIYIEEPYEDETVQIEETEPSIAEPTDTDIDIPLE